MTSLDDIIFEKLNKTYGAYTIRKAYHTHVFTGVIAATTFIISLLIWLSTVKYSAKEKVISEGINSTIYAPSLPPLINKPKPSPPVKVRESKRQTSTAARELNTSEKPPVLFVAGPTNKEGRSKTSPAKKQQANTLAELPVEEPPVFIPAPALRNNDIKALDRKVSLHLKDVTLKYALRAIENEAAVNFIYSRNHIDMRGTVTVNADQKKLLEVLEDLLNPRMIGYHLVEDDFIILASKLKVLY